MAKSLPELKTAHQKDSSMNQDSSPATAGISTPNEITAPTSITDEIYKPTLMQAQLLPTLRPATTPPAHKHITTGPPL